jgi:hypothetical protein
MVQSHQLLKITDRGFEDYVSMKLHIKNSKPVTTITETQFQFTQTSPTSTTGAEISQKGGLTIADKASTAIAIFLASDTDDNAYDGQSVLIHYITNAGIKTNATITFNTANSTTEVAGPTNFYCWNLEDYTAATVVVSSVAVQAGDNVYIGETGVVAGAEKRLVKIAAAATYPVITTLYGAGDVYGLEEADTAGDVGKVCTSKYWTPWGQLKEMQHTLQANTTTINRCIDTTTGLVTVDFFRPATYKTTAVAGKYIALGYDADKRAGTATIDVFYAVIEEANFESIHSRLMAPGAAYGRLYLGDIMAYDSLTANYATLQLTFTPYGDIARTVTWSFYGDQQFQQTYGIRLDPLSEVTLKLADNGANPVSCGVILRSIQTYG